MNNQEKYHPILTQMDPSPEQVLPILSRGQDIAVTAGAGTGKTRTLVARYLSLLAERVPLRRIVAITFTKKAAREMRNRIREEVRKYLAKPDLPRLEYIFWRDVYENLDAARISTIHSLATDILRQFPAQMNLDPQFELLDDGQSARIRSQAVEAALGWAAQDEKASFLFITYGDWKLRRVINELVNNKLDIQDALNAAPDDLWGKWQGLLIQPLKEFVEHPVVQAGLDGLVSLEQGNILRQAEDAGDLFVDDFRIIAEKWKKIQLALPSGNWVEISRCLWPLRDHLKQKGRKENWAPANPRLIIKEIQPIYDDLLGSNNFDLGVDQKLAQEILPGLKAVFQYAIQWYDNTKTMLNGLDFDDLESKSLELLREFPEARKYWQEEIQAMLVDEYQDTNDRQRELVNLLNADRDHLFIVGDGKQSIYRFRGADVAVFRQEQDIIREKGKNFHLSTSYRAHNNLLENLNTILKPVLGVESDRPFIEPFAGLLPGRTTKARIMNPPYIEFHLVAGAKTDGAERTAAEAVAARVIDIVGKEQQNRNQDSPPLNFGDVAILCRASSSFSAYESAFEKAGIPYLTIAGQGFYDRPEIRDMLNTLQVFADPQNDLAVAGLLRSPVIGLSDDVLLKIREFQITEKLPSLMEASGKITAIEIGDRNFCLIRDFLFLVDRFEKMVGRSSAADIIGHYLNGTGYLAALTLNGFERSGQNLKKLVIDAQNSAIVNIPDFIKQITELRNVAIREGEAQSIIDGAVQIMTVHQSKGLEFPVVVLGDASKKERFRRDMLVDERFGMIPPYSESLIREEDSAMPEIIRVSSLAYELANNEENEKEEAESDRLLYVAATRAQELLIVSGVVGSPNKDQKLPKLTGWLGKLNQSMGIQDFEFVLEVDGNRTHHHQLKSLGVEASLSIYEINADFNLEISAIKVQDKSDQLDEDLVLPDFSPVEGIDSQIRKDDKDQIIPATSSSKRTYVPARIIGEIVHRALERWKFPKDGEIDFDNWINTAFQSLSLGTEKEIQQGANRAKKILERFQESDLFERMNRSAHLKHEIHHTIMTDEGKYHQGSIDAMFEEDGHWILVEFKTDEIRDQKSYDWMWQHEDYQEQVSRYLQAAEKILGERPVPILCFLNYQERVHLVTDRW